MNVIKLFERTEIFKDDAVCTPDLSGRYEFWGGIRATNPLKTTENLHYIHIQSDRDAWENMSCSKGKDTFFLTDLLIATKQVFKGI
jgi:hypothetical protein